MFSVPSWFAVLDGEYALLGAGGEVVQDVECAGRNAAEGEVVGLCLNGAEYPFAPVGVVAQLVGVAWRYVVVVVAWHEAQSLYFHGLSEVGANPCLAVVGAAEVG